MASDNKKISLRPFKFKDAVADLLKVKPPKKNVPSRGKRAKSK